MIKVDIKVGDTILIGKFLNKKVKVKEIGVDEYGNPTVNGKSIMKVRIPKLYKSKEELKDLIKEALSNITKK